jgi:phospholipase A1
MHDQFRKKEANIMRYSTLIFCVALVLLQSAGLWAADMSICATIEKTEERLACYDRLASEAPAPAEPKVFGMVGQNTSPLVDRWELTPETKRPNFTFRPYKPIYILPVVFSSNINASPCSEEGGSSKSCAQTDVYDLNDVEAKFQISFKTKMAEGLFGGNGDLWAGYTQSSRWQVYNNLSAPFRETNYEPEVMLTFATDYEMFGWKVSMLGGALNHQSNGRADPLSRSWNRIIGMAALEKGDWIIGLRPWYRIPEKKEDDNNAQIEDFVGRAEFLINKRNSLKVEGNRGSGTFEWTFPVSGYLKGYMQLFSGYGESLIDYNHHQNTVGIGVTLVDWQ